MLNLSLTATLQFSVDILGENLLSLFIALSTHVSEKSNQSPQIKLYTEITE